MYCRIDSSLQRPAVNYSPALSLHPLVYSLCCPIRGKRPHVLNTLHLHFFLAKHWKQWNTEVPQTQTSVVVRISYALVALDVMILWCCYWFFSTVLNNCNRMTAVTIQHYNETCVTVFFYAAAWKDSAKVFRNCSISRVLFLSSS